MIPRLRLPNVSIDDSPTLSLEQMNYLRNVLRLETGDKVRFFCGDGLDYEFEIVSLDRSKFLLRFLQQYPADSDPSLSISWVQALLKGDKTSELVRSMTALGVSRVWPCVSERAIAKPNPGKVERWKKIAEEASRQCGRTTIPQFLPTLGLREILESSLMSDRTLRLFFWEDAEDSLDSAFLRLEHPDEITFAVGPEGGWSASEANYAREKGWRLIRLGRRILRAELFPISALSVIQDRLGQL